MMKVQARFQVTGVNIDLSAVDAAALKFFLQNFGDTRQSMMGSPQYQDGRVVAMNLADKIGEALQEQ